MYKYSYAFEGLFLIKKPNNSKISIECVWKKTYTLFLETQGHIVCGQIVCGTATLFLNTVRL